MYKNDPVSIVWVDKYEEQALHQQFSDHKYHLVAYKPKRGRYSGYPKVDFSVESLRAWMDSILGGGGEFEKFQDDSLQLKS